ncbi:MAG TPA: hypothetical protein VM901_06405 [Bdellovibrionota bacterium]|jgi:hypothetical protein|nr:hypothetical protein [Bdellovibrionota bacterium]
MKKLVWVLASFAAFATTSSADEQGTLFPELEIAEAYKTLVDTACGENARIECSESKYEVAKFDFDTEVKKLRKERAPDQLILKWADAADNLSFYVDDKSFDEAFAKLRKAKQFKAVFGVVPPEDCTESESCSDGSLLIYTIDGRVLSFDYDYNT